MMATGFAVGVKARRSLTSLPHQHTTLHVLLWTTPLPSLSFLQDILAVAFIPQCRGA